jgi:acetyltransferase-like isoleucine patch superfamily enzyme
MNEFKNKVIDSLELPHNTMHPLVYISGNPSIGEGSYIGLFSEINANKSKITIGKNCDIASFVSINCADSHKLTLGLSKEIERKEIIIEDNVFIGSHCFIGGYVKIGHHSVISAGTILINKQEIPPYSLIFGNPAVIKEGYYKDKVDNNDTPQ